MSRTSSVAGKVRCVLDPYRRVLSVPGALRFTSAGLVARLPISMISLGLLLLVQDATGSYGVAGSVAAAFVIAQASFAVVQGRWLDRLGQRRVLLTVGTVFAVALSLATLSVTREWPLLVTYLTAAVAGGTLPSVGSCVRARWAHVLHDRPREVSTAYAFEGVADEAVFILGPILVTVLATVWHPVAGLVIAITASVVGTWSFAAQRSTEPPPQVRRHHDGTWVSMPWPLVLPLAAVCVALGVLFGAAEVTTVAFSEARDATRWAGPLLALWAAGSLVAGVLTGVVRWQQGPEVRVRVGALGMAAAMTPLAFIDSIPVMALALFVGGFAISPTLISTMALLERSVPRARLTEAMAIVHTGLLAGVAPGAWASGLLVDRYGSSAAFAVPVAAGLVAALAAQTLRGRRLDTALSSVAG